MCHIYYIGLPVGDLAELTALDNALFHTNSSAGAGADGFKIAIGSVKTNVGHCEAASGLVGIIKVCLAYCNQFIPANLHDHPPRLNVEMKELLDQKFSVVTSNRPWKGGVTGVSAHGIGGVCTHIILTGGLLSGLRPCRRRCAIAVGKGVPKCSNFSCRTAKSLRGMTAYLTSEYKDQSSPLPLSLSATASLRCEEHPYRGFIIQQVDSQGNEGLFDVIQNAAEQGAASPDEVWWVFTGMGAHWTDMGASLVSNPVFLQSLQQCQEVLFRHGVIPEDKREDYLLNIIMKTDIDEYNRDSLVATLALVAIQIGLIHLLRWTDVPMTHCTGHSTGEFAAAYASGHITLQQTILIAYYRGKALQDAVCPVGGMAATGLSWEQVCTRLAIRDVQVWPACHNGVGSTTVSGDLAAVELFVQELKEEDIFARMINSSGAAFHSPIMENAVDLFDKHMSALFADTACVKRSKCWITSCDMESTCPSANAAYFVQNLRDPVRFAEAIELASDAAVMIEVGPHALLRSAIRATKPSVKYVSLQKKGADAVHEAFKQLGALYVGGVAVRLEKLLTASDPEVVEPLATPVPNKVMYSWDHSKRRHVPRLASRGAPPPPLSSVNDPALGSSLDSAASNIHASCVIDRSAYIHPSAVIGPFTVIGANVSIAAGCVIGKCCQIEDSSMIGEKTVLENSISITGETVIGENNLFYSGVNVGARGEWKSDKDPAGVVVIGDNNIFRENTVITRPFSRSETHIGSGCYIMHGVTISHDVFVGDHVQIAAMCVLAGYCNVFRGCFLGVQSSFHQFTTLGAYCMIGMSSRVTRDVPPCTTVVNNECIKLNSYGLIRNHGYSEEDVQELERYYQTEWPTINSDTNSVFKDDMETFLQCRIENTSNRAIAPIMFGKSNGSSSLPATGDRDVLTTVTSCLHEALNLPLSQLITQQQEFEQLGMDSLVTVALASTLSQVLGQPVLEQDVSKNNTLEKMIAFLGNQKE